MARNKLFFTAVSAVSVTDASGGVPARMVAMSTVLTLTES